MFKTLKTISIISILLASSSCGYSRNFGKFYGNKMSEIDENHKTTSALLIKTMQAPFYLSFYLLGGLGTIMDVPNWKRNFSTSKKSKCFDGFKNNHYSVLGIDLKLDQNTQLINVPECVLEPSGDSILLVFGIDDPNYKRDEGNTIVLQQTLTVVRDNLRTDQIKNYIEILADKPIAEIVKVQNQKNNRLSVISYKIGDLLEDEEKICKIFTASFKDVEAPNAPKSVKYLIQTGFYKTCYLKNYKIFTISAISFRTTPRISKNLTREKILEKLNKFSESIIFNDGKSLQEIVQHQPNLKR